MAWSAPPTASVGGTIFASWWNTYIRDNLNTEFPAVIQAIGDIPLGTGTNVIGRLPIGGNNSFVRMNSSANSPEWVTLIGSAAYVYNTGAVSIAASSADTTLTFNTAEVDTDGMTNLGVHNERITITTAGTYIICAGISLTQVANPNTSFQFLWLNQYNSGNTLLNSFGQDMNGLDGANGSSSGADFNISQTVCVIVSASVGDYFQAHAKQSYTSAINTDTGDRADCFLSAIAVMG